MNGASDEELSKLFDLFAEMAARLQSVSAPRSIAEIELTTRDRDRIQNAFSNLMTDPGKWLADRRPRWVLGDLEVSPSEVFACMLLILGAETCRDESIEGAVWPCVRACLPDKYEANVFPGSQPSTDLKDGLVQITEKLRLRHAIGWEGSLEYFETVKLQFGFTYRGARRRLAEWIVGIGEPVAVQALRGATSDHSGVASSQFRRLWLALKNYRANRLSEGDVRKVLELSPWIRNGWIDELIKQAGARREQLGVGEETPGLQQAEAGDRAQFPGDLRLIWNSHRPELYLELDEDEIQSVVSEWNASMLEIAIDASQPCRWRHEQNGWRGSRRLPITAWSATTLTIGSGDGRHSADFDLADSGLSEDVIVFDENQGDLLGPRARMQTTRSYILLCDESLELGGVEGTNHVQMNGRRVYRVTSGWQESLRLEINGLVYWQAPVSEEHPLEQPELVVSNESSNVGRLGSSERLLLSGVPRHALDVSLLVGTAHREVRLEQFKTHWRTIDPVSLDVKLLTGETRLRVRLRTEENHRCWRPKTDWNVQGLAVMAFDEQRSGPPRWEAWEESKKALNCARGRILARVFFARDSSSFEIFEGSRFVNKGMRPFQLSGLIARGAPLLTKDGIELAPSVEDQGCVLRFFGQFMGRNLCRVVLRDRIKPSENHEIMLWTKSGQVQKIKPKGHRMRDRRWDLPPYAEPIAWGIGYDGRCIGSTWRIDELAALVSRQPSVGTFALLRWFRLPVLSSALRMPVCKAIESNLDSFLKAWLSNEGLDRHGLVHEDVPEELFPVLRDLLWHVKIRSPSHANGALQLFGRRAEAQREQRRLGDANTLAVRNMAEICPPFAWRVLRLIRRKRVVRGAIRGLLGLDDTTALDQGVRTALTPMYPALGKLLGCEMRDVEPLRRMFIATLERDGSIDWETEQRFRRLAESAIGSRYLAAAVLVASSGEVVMSASHRVGRA